MALRLTGITTPDDAAGSTGGGADPRPSTGLRLSPLSTSAPTAPSGEAFGAGLREQARLQLAVNQLERYRALFDRAAEHEDSHARYHARVLLLQEGLSAASQATSQKQALRLFVTIAGAALDALEEETREPVLLNYAGVALHELWSLDAAFAMFKAAHSLDPSIPHLKRNLHEVGRRRKTMRPGKPLHPSVPALAAQAKKLAPRARPATDMTLSLCMIVRDEEEMLPRCLAAVAPAVDEIIIVDTGSTDRTIEIAHEFGAKVIERDVDGFVLRRPQRLLRGRRQRLDHLPRRRRGARHRGRPPPPGTHGPGLAGGVLPGRDQLHRRPRRRRRDHQQRAARVPQPPSLPLRRPAA